MHEVWLNKAAYRQYISIQNGFNVFTKFVKLFVDMLTLWITELEFRPGHFWLGELHTCLILAQLHPVEYLIGSLYDSLSSQRKGFYKILKDCWLTRRWLWTFHLILSRKKKKVLEIKTVSRSRDVSKLRDLIISPALNFEL